MLIKLDKIKIQSKIINSNFSKSRLPLSFNQYFSLQLDDFDNNIISHYDCLFCPIINRTIWLLTLGQRCPYYYSLNVYMPALQEDYPCCFKSLPKEFLTKENIIKIIQLNYQEAVNCNMLNSNWTEAIINPQIKQREMHGHYYCIKR